MKINIISLPILLIKMYKLIISPLLPNACRFYPTCSSYAIEALSKHGLFKGCFLSIKRILRCHPYCDGGYDPVP
ncbi:MAG: membrane protein insertion efficiency factor YidD [Spirochaetes bacterium]|jgi:putative membrane protein insertion efficiency factor|nr:membrane protein insertion efficiency factor YidD [Spirochaetota bacterium]MBP8988192.1 membrane protein insertion efficiency factor YidD [Spirochaetota bacterium]HQL44185.1 membrane protein insertion efficiency factor YidD [Spirochaetota bacterium]